MEKRESAISIGIWRKGKNYILEYLRNFEPCKFTTAPAEDPFTEEQVEEADCGYSDGVYTWYETEIYCLEKYDLALTEEFRTYVKNKMCREE